jgi:membrane protease YdiL (CAAX protease family)
VRAARSIVRVLVGYGLMYAALESTARLGEGLGQVLVMLLAGSVGLLAALGVVMLLHGHGTVPAALRALGLYRPGRVALGLSAVASTVLVACMPLVFRLAGADLVLPDNWLVLALGIVVLNGIAEETIYRGYLFRRLREGHTFTRAVLIGIGLHALAHVPLIATGGIALGLSGVAVAAIGFPALAYLYERGSNTIWAPAMLHAAADLIILPLSASSGSVTAALTAAALIWVVLAVALTYVAVIVVMWSSARECAGRTAITPRSATA